MKKPLAMIKRVSLLTMSLLISIFLPLYLYNQSCSEALGLVLSARDEVGGLGNIVLGSFLILFGLGEGIDIDVSVDL